MSFDKEKAFEYIKNIFWGSYIPSLSEFVAIPNTSRLYDPEWNTNGLLEQAAHHVEKWIHELGIKGLKTQLLKEKELSPLLLIEVEGEIKDHTILYYGHFDKQPHMGGWDEDKGPTKPVQVNNRLYGRGSGDDGYSAYSSMLAVKAVQDQGIPLPSSSHHIQELL